MAPAQPSRSTEAHAPRGWVLIGPTGAGKTDVAHQIALQRGARILSADSMLVYAGMDVGTAKPCPDLLREVRYGGIDIVPAGTAFSVAAWLDAARAFAADAQADGVELIVTGGTGLYVRCLLEGLRAVPPPDEDLRARWFPHVAAHGVADLAREVGTRAPEAYARMSEPDRSNARRLIRVLEQRGSGVEPKRDWQAGGAAPVILGLQHERDALRARIRERAEHMFEAGLLEEVATLSADGRLSATAAQAIGYAEALAVRAGALTVPDAIERTITRTWRLARKQMTWFRHQATVAWLEVAPDEDVAAIADRVSAEWSRTGPATLGGLIND